MTQALRVWARQLLTAEGFAAEPNATVDREAEAAAGLAPALLKGVIVDVVRDLRDLAWSSIDNVETRDVDQLEVAEAVDGGTRVRVAIADVDAFAPKGSAVDARAAQNTVTVYGIDVLLPMLPTVLSEGVSSLLPGQDRLALVAEFVVGGDGVPRDGSVYRAIVRNTVQLDYDSLNEWFAGRAALPERAVPLEAQLRLQHAAAVRLHSQRLLMGALEFERRETRAVLDNGEVVNFAVTRRGAARDLIEDFMIAANVVIASFLEEKHVSWVRRMVGAPERWEKIVEIASRSGVMLSATPDRVAVGAFLRGARERDPAGFEELSLSVLRLLGSGHYVVERRSEDLEAHFALGVDDYTHFTAPNRRYADIVTQRIVKAVLAATPSPYSDAELDAIAERCTTMEDKAHSVERKVAKRAGVLLLQQKIGEQFDAVVTSVDKGRVFATLVSPAVDGRIVDGSADLKPGSRLRVTVASVNVEKGHVDLAQLGGIL